MTYFFGDGFDLYAQPSDLVSAGTYWDATSTVNAAPIVAGRFAGSRAVNIQNSQFDKASGQNDAVHHLVFAFMSTSVAAGSSGAYFQLSDGATGQCSVVFEAAGNITLRAGGPGGTVLATYSSAAPVSNVWYAFEIEIVINNTTGSIAIRKNGNTSNDFFLGSLNTRVSANNYANKLSFSSVSTTVHNVDDLLWRSGATVPFVGDVRCYTRRPASDAQAQWSTSGASPLIQTVGITGSLGPGGINTTARMEQITIAAISSVGTIGTVSVVAQSGVSGNAKCAIWADAGGVPGAVLATSASQPIVVGTNAFTISPPLAVTAGQVIWIGAIGDTAAGAWQCGSLGNHGGSAVMSYATFPQANPVTTTGLQDLQCSLTFNLLPGNYAAVADIQQDAAVTYNYSSTVGQNDLYAISPITNTPTSILGVVTRGYFEKSDAGTRNCEVQLKSGVTTVQSPSTALNTVWGWLSRTDLTDPATGAAWTATAVNNVQIGPVVTA